MLKHLKSAVLDIACGVHAGLSHCTSYFHHHHIHQDTPNTTMHSNTLVFLLVPKVEPSFYPTADLTTFTAEIPLPPSGMYATSVDFIAAMAGFEQCSGAMNDENGLLPTVASTTSTTTLPTSSPAPTEAQPYDDDDDGASLVEFEGSAQFVVTVPQDPLAGDAAWAVAALEVPPNPSTPVQSVVVSPIV